MSCLLVYLVLSKRLSGSSDMRIGVPTEVKNSEYRVGLVPMAVKELVAAGHEVFVQTDAGLPAGFGNDAYVCAGARVAATAAKVYQQGELIVKVKEPQPEELDLIEAHHIVFTYLHLAANEGLTTRLMQQACCSIAYELVEDREGRFPLLIPMSEVAGRMAVQAGARCLEKNMGGKGILLGGVPGVAAAKVVVLGGGVVGTQATLIALGMGARVALLDKSLSRLRQLDELFSGRVELVYSSVEPLQKLVADADLVIGAVLLPGAAAPKLLTRANIAAMAPGSVVVDVAIDQGGCFETSRPTTHAQPVYIEEGVVHYCVANIPGAVPATSALALGQATLPYVLAIANQGLALALKRDAGLMAGLSTWNGHLCCQPVADQFDLPWLEPAEIVANKMQF
jgi:alanine dehydrogenase